LYVFCLLAHKDKSTLDPLNMDQWQFFVLATEEWMRRSAHRSRSRSAA
jgi:hypothetical protein